MKVYVVPHGVTSELAVANLTHVDLNLYSVYTALDVRRSA
jgi:hypothetical protein